MKVLCFSAFHYNLDCLSNLNNDKLLKLAKAGMSNGREKAQICSLSEFQRLYNWGLTQDVDNYIFFVEEED